MVAFSTPRKPTLRAPARSMTCATQKNVGDIERVASVIGGGLLILNAVPSRPIAALVLGGFGAALIYRGVTGHCECYQAMGITTRSKEDQVTATPVEWDFVQKTGYSFARG